MTENAREGKTADVLRRLHRVSRRWWRRLCDPLNSIALERLL